MIDDHELTVSQQHRGAPFAKAQGVICIIGIIRATGIQDEVGRTRQYIHKIHEIQQYRARDISAKPG